MDFNPTYKPFGRKAILIEWDAIMNESILKEIIQFQQRIIEKKQGVFTDTIVGYNSLTIKYKKEVDFNTAIKILKSIYKNQDIILKKENFLWKIPVCYDIEFGIDLEEISIKKKLPIEEIIKLHVEKTYTVFFIGFLPGFLYLGGLNKQLFVDRKSTPRLQVAKGAVAIGGQQTGVYPSESAGGWNIIGKTPVNFFNIENSTPCFASSGDQIEFISISLEEFYRIEKAVQENTYQLSKILLND